MFEIIRADEHFQVDHGWLKARWHFSFSHFHDPERMNFGSLRVLNHDRIQPGGEFPMHSHSDMEVVTWIIRGKLKHEDSTGSSSVISRNEIQRMSAGTGISHSEQNPSPDQSCHLLQIWFLPEKKGIEPGYKEKSFSEDQLSGDFFQVLGKPGGVTVHQDVRGYVTHLANGETTTFQFEKNRRGYLVVMEGSGIVNGEPVSEGDAVKIENESDLSIESVNNSEWFLIALP